MPPRPTPQVSTSRLPLRVRSGSGPRNRCCLADQVKRRRAIPQADDSAPGRPAYPDGAPAGEAVSRGVCAAWVGRVRKGRVGLRGAALGARNAGRVDRPVRGGSQRWDRWVRCDPTDMRGELPRDLGPGVDLMLTSMLVGERSAPPLTGATSDRSDFHHRRWAEMQRRTFDVLMSVAGLVLAGIMFIAGGLLTWGYSFTNTQVHSQLAAQQIYFPPKGSEALSPAEFPALQQYAGQQVVNGEQARA